MDGWVVKAAEQFWDKVGGEIPFPRNLDQVLSFGFPLSCVGLPMLKVSVIEEWLEQQGAPYQFLCGDRALRGCVVAARGKGIIFTCSDDPEDERRFTVAHELAHYLQDYDCPRQRAVAALGRSILEVLDGERDPTLEERVSALLDDVALGVYFNLMPRSASGEIDRSLVLKREERADRLALELLAPRDAVQQHISEAATSSRGKAAFVERLRKVYGLPASVARSYVGWLCRPRRQSTAAWLGL